MRDELKIARLREELRNARIARYSAAKKLESHQNAVANLETRGLANDIDRQGLAAAQSSYDTLTDEVTRLEDQLAFYDL